VAQRPMAPERRRLFLGTGWNLASTLTALAISVVLRPVVVQFVGVSGYGIWVSTLAIASLAGLLGDLGASGALTRLVAEQEGRGDTTGSAVTSSLIVGLLSGALAGLGLAAISPWIERAIGFAGFASLLQIQAVQMPFNLGIATLLGRLQGQRNFRLLAGLTMANALGHLLLGLAFLYAGYGLVGLVSASLLSSAVGFGGALVHARNHLTRAGWKDLKHDAAQLVPFGSMLTATNALSTVMYQLDIVFLAILVGSPAVIGTYALAIFVTRALWIVPGSVSVTTYPTISGYAASRDDRRVSRYLTTTLIATVAVTGSLAGALVAFGRPLISLLFGPDASPAYEIALLLLPGTAALGSMRSIAASITSVGRPEIGMRISALGLALLFASLVLLVPRAAGPGAAVAVSLSFGAVAAVLLWAVRRYVGPLAEGRSGRLRVSATASVATVSVLLCFVMAVPASPNPAELAAAVFAWAGTSTLLFLASGGRATWGGLWKRAPVASARGPSP